MRPGAHEAERSPVDRAVVDRAAGSDRQTERALARSVGRSLARSAGDVGGAGGPGRGAKLPVVDKPALVRELGAVDIADLRCHVDKLSERAWRQADEAKENAYICFAHTQHVVFRFIFGNQTPLRFYSTPIWLVWQRLLQPIMTQAAAAYGYAQPIYPKAMLARLEAGYGIDQHTDGETGVSHALTHKIHVPLQTNPQATLTVGGTDFHLPAGRAFEVNNLATHSAFNGGREDRIHFIFEVFDGTEIAAGELDATRAWVAQPVAAAGGPVAGANGG